MDWEQVVLVQRVVQVERGQAVHRHRRWELARAAEQVVVLAVEAPEQGERF